MPTTARKARKREHRAAQSHLLELIQSGATYRSAPMKAARERVEASRFVKAPKVATALSDRTGFWLQPLAKVIRELKAREVTITPKLNKTIQANDAGRKRSLRQSNAYGRNYSR